MHGIFFWSLFLPGLLISLYLVIVSLLLPSAIIFETKDLYQVDFGYPLPFIVVDFLGQDDPNQEVFKLPTQMSLSMVYGVGYSITTNTLNFFINIVLVQIVLISISVLIRYYNQALIAKFSKILTIKNLLIVPVILVLLFILFIFFSLIYSRNISSVTEVMSESIIIDNSPGLVPEVKKRGSRSEILAVKRRKALLSAFLLFCLSSFSSLNLFFCFTFLLPRKS